MKSKNEFIVLGGGCFWCTEAIFKNIKGVIEITPGYAGGNIANPTYGEVSSGKTGHAETIEVEYDPKILNFDDLLEVFFGSHDPTTKDRQGGDVGSQYRSIILYTSENQKIVAEKFIQNLESKKAFNALIVTEIRPLDHFYEAENYHKNYYDSNREAPYCKVVIAPKISKVKEKYKNLVKA